MSDIKILCCYHKPDPILKSDIVIPIHAGRAVASEENKKALSGIIGDDTGDNISHLNPWYAELTVIYWAWKNRAALGNPEYIGLMHYRRIFTTSQRKLLDTDEFFRRFQREFKEKPTILQKLIAQNEIIVPPPFICGNKRENYKKMCFIQDFDDYLEILKQQNPTESVQIDAASQSNFYYPLNMFVIRRDWFDQYCRFIFNAFFEFQKHRNLSSYTGPQQRVCGLLGERVSSLFFELQQAQHPRLKLATLPVICRDTEPFNIKEITLRYIFRHPFFFLKAKTWAALNRFIKSKTQQSHHAQ